MKLKLKIMAALVGASALPLVSFAATTVTPVQPLYPYVITGKVVDFDNVAYDSSSGIALTVRKVSDSAVLAKSEVTTPGVTSSTNFRLDVPVASAETTSYAQVGDTLTLTAVDSGGNVYSGFLTGENALIDRPGGSTNIRVMLASDENANGVADEYEEQKQYEGMYMGGVYNEDYVYDPAADDDGDGMTNYAEYLAGTDPFVATDYLKFTKAEMEGDTFKVSFETNPGRSYLVRGNAAPGASTTGWKEHGRAVNDSKSWGERTLYLIKDGDKCFYRLELE